MGAVEPSGDQPSGIAIGAVLLDKLRVDGVLGRGGMGTVYRVTHLGTRHVRALKVMNPELTLHPEALARFLREATVSGTLAGSNVVETLDSGRLADGSHYVLMELLEGRSLADELEGGRRLPLDRIARLLAQAADGLAVAHDAGIVHRDIKPDNLFVVHAGTPREHLKLLDFGVAHFHGSSDAMGALTGDNAILGTPLYMAPEQIGAANKADGRADVYALGVVLYEALSGNKPYTATSFAELVAHIVEGRAPSLTETVPGLPRRAHEVVERAMARRKEDRFQTARALADALRSLTTGDVTAVDALGATQAIGSLATATPAPATSAPTPPATRSDASLRWVWWVAGGACTLAIGAIVLAPREDDDENVTAPSTASAIAADASVPRDVFVAPDVFLEPDGGLDAGSDTSAPRTPRAPTTGHVARPDAGRRRSGLLDPDEIYGDGP